MLGGVKLIGIDCGFSYPFEGGIISSLLIMLGLNPFVNVGVIWYLRAIFMFAVISPLLYSSIKKIGIMLPIFIFAGYGVYCTFVYFSNMWDYFASLRGIAYFTLGISLRMGVLTKVIDAFYCVISQLEIIGMLLLILKVIAWRYGLVKFGNVCDFLMIVPLMVSIWKVCKYIRMPQIIAMNSFPLYLMHSYFLLLSIALLHVIGARKTMDNSITVIIIRCVFSIVASLALTTVIKKRAPKFATILFGGR